jgi:hypothetical protein
MKEFIRTQRFFRIRLKEIYLFDHPAGFFRLLFSPICLFPSAQPRVSIRPVCSCPPLSPRKEIILFE